VASATTAHLNVPGSICGRFRRWVAEIVFGWRVPGRARNRDLIIAVFCPDSFTPRKSGRTIGYDITLIVVITEQIRAVGAASDIVVQVSVSICAVT
jgi:hypothetical protein